ncbi:hypothetical protein FQN50_000891 [Emmonsiellopsis sp. PD_5]|nr:hypothetical protein FQN50_000891 [Emmonsiellopsis sp. PD_5]
MKALSILTVTLGVANAATVPQLLPRSNVPHLDVISQTNILQARGNDPGCYTKNTVGDPTIDIYDFDGFYNLLESFCSSAEQRGTLPGWQIHQMKTTWPTKPGGSQPVKLMWSNASGDGVRVDRETCKTQFMEMIYVCVTQQSDMDLHWFRGGMWKFGDGKKQRAHIAIGPDGESLDPCKFGLC